MAFGVDDYAIGKGLDLALTYGSRTVRKIWSEKPIDRLLLLLHWEFAEQTGASLDHVLALKTDGQIREPLQRLLDGKAFDHRPLGGEIARHFPDLPNADAVAGAMARAAPRLAPFARDGSEAEAAISAQLEDNFAQVRGLFARNEAQLAELRAEFREQMAGLHHKLDVRLPQPAAATAAATEAPRQADEKQPGRPGRPPVTDPAAQAGAVELLLDRIRGSDDPELTAAVELARAGDHEAAAERFDEQAQRFEAEQLDELAEECRANQAAALDAAGHEAAAREVRMRLVRHQMHRGSDLAVLEARRLLETAPADERWRFEALLAEADWPEHPYPAMDVLERAVERAEGEERVLWAAASAEVMVLFGEFERVRRVTDSVREYPLAEGARLRLELDWLEAVEQTEGVEAAESAWGSLLAWTERAESARTRATVLARRAAALVHREELDAAIEAYGRALEEWASLPGYEDQVAEVFYAIQTAPGLMGRLRPPLAELRATAAGLRGGAQSPAARADAIEARAMRAQLNEKLFDALRGFWLALALHRRVGNLRGVLYNRELLGELLLEAGRGSAAVALFVKAGREKRAARAAERAATTEIADALSLGGPAWERAASYAVIAQVGRRAPPEVVDALAPQVLAESEQPMGGLVGPQPANRAREALAALLLALPDEHRDRALVVLRNAATTQHPVIARRAAQSLLLATNAGISDETHFLIERYLAEPSIVGVSSPWIAARLAADHEARERIEEASLAEIAPALEALAIADLEPKLPELQELADERITNTLRSLKDADPTHTVGIGGYEDLGIAARLATPEMRDRLGRALGGLARDIRYPEANRASAANAVFNLASRLSDETRAQILPEILPLAAGDYELSQWDDSPLLRTDPLARFKVSFSSPGDLQAAALQAAGALASPDGAETVLEQLLYEARLDERANVASAAYESLARLPGLGSAEAIEVGLAHEDAGVRAAALRAWFAKTGQAPRPVLAARLVSDPDLNVRLVLLNLAAEIGVREIVDAFREDPDAYVRATAETRVAHG